MYCLRLFILILQELHCLLQFTVYCGVFIEMYMYAKFRLDWLLREQVTWLSISLL